MQNNISWKLFSSHFRVLAIVLLLIGGSLFSQIANAVPAFSRQTDLQCMSCHFQSYPALNEFGRKFKADGYTLVGSQKKIEGNNISLPGTLNASIITKIRYQLKETVDDNRGEIQWPDEAALLVGGRLSKNAGFLMELGLGPEGAVTDTGTGAVTCVDATGLVVLPNDPGVVSCTADTGTGTGDVTGSYLSTKFHFNVTDNLALIAFSTDGLGVGYGFEMLNTGLQRSQRPIENRKGFSAGQMLGISSGGATGVTVAYHEDDFFVNYSHWAPTWGNVNANVFGGLAHYVRAAYMPNIGGWDTGIGISMISGTVNVGPTNPATKVMVDGMGIDAQAQGKVNDMPLGLYMSYGITPKSSGTGGGNLNIYNTSLTDDSTALGFLAKLGVIPGKTQVYLAYGSLDKATSVTDITIGVQQMLAQNIKLELFNVSSDAAGNDYTMFMFFAGF